MPLGDSLDQLGLRCRAQQSGPLPPHGVTEVNVAPRPRRFIGLSSSPVGWESGGRARSARRYGLGATAEGAGV